MWKLSCQFLSFSGFYSPAILKEPRKVVKGPFECLPCPLGAICLGEDNIPLAKNGYWAPNGTASFFPCEWSTKVQFLQNLECLYGKQISQACQGITVQNARKRLTNEYDPFCGPGHIGTMCNACIEEQYYMLGGVCNREFFLEKLLSKAA